MKEQIEHVLKRDGYEKAVEYAKRSLQAYRNAAKYRNPETGARHFVHMRPYRPHVVRGIYEIRNFLREGSWINSLAKSYEWVRDAPKCPSCGINSLLFGCFCNSDISLETRHETS